MSDYTRWFIGNGHPAAPVVMVILLVIGIGYVLVGAAQKDSAHVLRGAIALGVLGLIILMFRPDLHGFTQFDTLAAKLFFGVLISVVAGLIVRAVARK